MGSVIFKSSNNNSYLLSRNKKTILYVEDEMSEFILKFRQKGGDSEPNEEYNYKFYNYLKNHGFFDKVDYKSKYKLDLEESDIKSSIANTYQITFEVTQACNLRCKYCGYGEFYNNFECREDQFMTFDLAKTFLDHIVSYINSDYNLSYMSPIELNFYGGEPLLNIKLIKEIVQYSKELRLNKNHFAYGMTTNAVKLDKYMDFLVENDFNLLISLDGNQNNNEYRVNANGLNTYQFVYKNAQELKKKYPKYFKEKVNFNAVLHDLNSVEEIFDYFHEKFDKQPNISELNSNGIVLERIEEFNSIFRNVGTSLKDSSRMLEIQEKMFDKMPDVLGSLSFIKNFHNNTFMNFNEMFVDKGTEIKMLTGTCMPFSRKIFLTTGGVILPCESVGQDFSLGNINNKEVHLDLKEVAKTYSELFKTYIKHCLACEMKGECVECLITKNKRDSYSGCDSFIKKEDFLRLGNYRMSFLENNKEYLEKLKEIVLK